MIKSENRLQFPRVIIAIFLLILIIIWGISIARDVRDYRAFHDLNITFIHTLKTIYYSDNYILTPLLFFAFAGLVMTNFVGWISISSLFYFLTFEMIFILIPANTYAMQDFLIPIISLCYIGFMNLKPTRDLYSIKSRQILLGNMVSISIGLVLAFLQAYLYANINLRTFEIIDRIR